MKAIGFKTSLPIEAAESLIAFEAEKPLVQGRDLLVRVEALSVNPVDYKIRQSLPAQSVLETPRIIGWDAAGTVEAVGDETQLFQVGDQVYYAGELNRPGSYAAYQAVDERIVGRRPRGLSLAQAAAMPLTALTAWEVLFDRMRISEEKDRGKSLLIIGGGGGVGSIAIQLAKQIAGLEVIATASRPESQDWCLKQGADRIVKPQDLTGALHKAGLKTVDFILDLVDTNAYWNEMVELIKPGGHIASITGSAEAIPLNKLKNKSASFSWEFMFTRSLYQTDDMTAQHHILNRIAARLEAGSLQSTLRTTFEGLTVENLKAAHRLQESGKTIGKTAIVC